MDCPRKLSICEGTVAKSLLTTRANTIAFEGHMPSLITFYDDIWIFARAFYPH